MSMTYSRRVASRVLLAQDSYVITRLLYAFSIAIFIFTLLSLTGLISFKNKASYQKILNVSLMADPLSPKKQQVPTHAKAIAKQDSLGRARLAAGDVSAQIGAAIRKKHAVKKAVVSPSTVSQSLETKKQKHQPVRRLATVPSAAERLAQEQAEQEALNNVNSKIKPQTQPIEKKPKKIQEIKRPASLPVKRVRGLQHNLPVATMKDEDALYLLAWRHQVEAVGNRLYARASHPGLAGKLKLLVAINPDGSLRHVVVKQSSGNQELDDFAIEIVERSSPFAPFTANMRKHTEVLEITRIWRFELGDKLNMQ